MLRKNPLGIYIDAIDWSRELEPSAERAHATDEFPSPSDIRPEASTPESLPLGSPLDPNLARPESAQPPE
jgi:hypothetical protein